MLPPVPLWLCLHVLRRFKDGETDTDSLKHRNMKADRLLLGNF